MFFFKFCSSDFLMIVLIFQLFHFKVFNIIFLKLDFQITYFFFIFTFKRTSSDPTFLNFNLQPPHLACINAASTKPRYKTDAMLCKSFQKDF